MTMVAAAPETAAPPERVSRTGWLREPGMGATLLITALSSGFGVILLIATAFLSAILTTNEMIGDSATFALVAGVLSVLLLGVALYVGAIVTANTFATVVAGRIRQIALLRLVGASARSQRAQIARQGLVAGTLGAVLGALIALVVAAATAPWAAAALGQPNLQFPLVSPSLVLPPLAVALTTWFAAWIGTRPVLSVTPLEALARTEERPASEVRGRGRSITAISLMVLGAVLIAAGIVVGMMDPLGVVIAFLGGLLSFTGMSLGATLIMPPLLRLVGRLFGGSAPARLAGENALRHPERASRMAIGVVMGVTLVTMFAVAAESAKAVMAASAGGELDPELATMMDSFSAVMIALVAVSAVIAAVGLVNLLTMGVVQRRRELGLLRSLGFTNQQVRQMVLLEAAHIAITALVFGLVLGVIYGWAGAQATLGAVQMPPEWTSPTFVAPAIPIPFLIGIIVATFVLTLIAAVVPTRLATRVAPVEALAVE